MLAMRHRRTTSLSSRYFPVLRGARGSRADIILSSPRRAGRARRASCSWISRSPTSDAEPLVVDLPSPLHVRFETADGASATLEFTPERSRRDRSRAAASFARVRAAAASLPGAGARHGDAGADRTRQSNSGRAADSRSAADRRNRCARTSRAEPRRGRDRRSKQRPRWSTSRRRSRCRSTSRCISSSAATAA